MTSQATLSRSILEESQKRTFPYSMSYAGLHIEVDRNVFSAADFHGWRLFTPHLPVRAGQRWLEIGPGPGITSCYLAREGAHVVALDISPAAVTNTLRNAKRNGVHVNAFVSDIYSQLDPSQKFDGIYWNLPFIRMPDNYEHRNVLEYGLFDPGYKFTERFFAEGKNRLTLNGKLYAGLANFADTNAALRIAREHGFTHHLIASMSSEEGVPVEFDLWQFTRLSST